MLLAPASEAEQSAVPAEYRLAWTAALCSEIVNTSSKDGCQHGRGAEPAGVRSLRADARHTEDSQRVHRAALCLPTRQSGNLPEGILPETGAGEKG